MSGTHGKVDAIVVGGGIPGIVASLYLANQGKSVELVERDASIGGLYRSIEIDGCWFDRGIRFVLECGRGAFDTLLVDGFEPDYLEEYTGSLPESHFVAGRLNTKTGCLDLTSLSMGQRVTAIIRMTTNPAPHDFKNASGYLGALLGPSITHSFMEPILLKLTGKQLRQILPATLDTFQLHRFVAAGTRVSHFLKQLPSIDEHLAYADAQKAPQSSVRKWYPREGGMETWIRLLGERLNQAGVVTSTNLSVDSIDPQSKSMKLNDGRTLQYGQLIWTLPKALFLRASGERPAAPPPDARDVHLFHMVANQPPQVSSYWVSCYDPEYATYRITLYGNFAEHAIPGQVSVEVLLGSEDPSPASDKIQNELVQMGIFPHGSEWSMKSSERLRRAIPIRNSRDGVESSELDADNDLGSDVVFCGPDQSEQPGLIPRLNQLADALGVAP